MYASPWLTIGIALAAVRMTVQRGRKPVDPMDLPHPDHFRRRRGLSPSEQLRAQRSLIGGGGGGMR
ncbi:MAG: hypothetical protein VW268_12055 [Rhodospirillaceae bacterium]